VRLHDLPPATVADALTRRTVPELRALAALIGSPKLQRKPELVDALERFLREPTNLRSELEHMMLSRYGGLRHVRLNALGA
jgi:hypothetical protein